MQPAVNFENFVDSWPLAVAAIEPTGVVSFANAAARKLLLELELVAVTLDCHMVVTPARSLADCIERGEKTLLASACDQSTTYKLQLFTALDKCSSITLLVAEECAAKTQLNYNSGQYGLTEAEMAIVSGLLSGLTLSDIAQQRQTSKNTIRSQLRAVFRKTNTHRQAELVKLFLTTQAKAIEES